MFRKKENAVTAKLDEAIMRIMEEMDKIGPYSNDYPKLIGHLQRTIALRKEKKSIDPNTFVEIGGTIVGILTILAFETKHIISAKAFGLIRRPKN